MVDVNNAHVREPGKSARQSKEVIANDAQRILDDPAYQRGYTALRDALVQRLENLQHDGREETDAYERELCRTLRTLRSTKRMMSITVQGQKLRDADFRGGKPETNEG